jgi:hypothetical protein
MMITTPIFAQLRSLVIVPVLGQLGLDSPAARNLVLGTAAQESGGAFLAQYPTGPARGFWQIESATHQDLLDRFLPSRPDLATTLAALRASEPAADQQLATNLAYAAAICRLLYFRIPEDLPAATDLPALGAYWKRWYNTEAGAGTAAEWTASFNRLIGDPPDV